MLWGIIMLAVGCKQEDADLGFTEIPEIELIGTQPLSVKAFKDSIVFTIAYKDADGDLGENNADAENLFLTDERIGITYPYRIQQLSPASVPIQGQLDVVLKHTLITDGSTLQNATYSIYIEDRAKHRSNTVTTPNIVVQE
ncbi:MAG: hypothetical protein IPL35_00185 [Sphingobacteriales bacterium]|nr:hypothetical protein [Sphingobacteriales bacterium]